MQNIKSALILWLSLLGLIACSDVTTEVATEQSKPPRSLEKMLGTQFTDVENAHFKPPQIDLIDLPKGGIGASIWGATGRDDSGNIYFGISTYAEYHDTAFLYQIDRDTKEVIAQSDVITQLKVAGLFKEGMSQNKLHSKFYQADDGYIYFSSFDEKDEDPRRNLLPTYGGHLWRKKPDDVNWEHLLATQEAIIAINTDGRFVYGLGYWNHVLYQYDTLSKRFNRITVGSTTGHISRNFLVTDHGTVFVPKVEKLPDGSVSASLMEYDSNLILMDAHPLEHYASTSRYNGHGIVSYVAKKNGEIFFVTGKGALYKITKGGNNKHLVEFVTILTESKEPESYFASLFSIDGEDFLTGLGRIPAEKSHSWFIHQISSNTTVFYDMPSLGKNLLLYGSVTRDDDGNLYVVGVDRTDPAKHYPMVVKLSY